ncbi:MAG: hypothetical protein AAFX87_16510 [Bacteroidota bacterium]
MKPLKTILPSEAVTQIVGFIKNWYEGQVSVDGLTISIPDLHLTFEYCLLFGEHDKPSYTPALNPLIAVRRIWEDQWLCKPEVIKSRIRALLKQNTRIYARTTQAASISGQLARDFIDTNHILAGTVAKHKYGLWHKEQLVTAASFSKGRSIARNGKLYQSYELIRQCTLLNHTVVGGLGKLLKAFIEAVQPDDIVTYVDLDWSDGKVYEQFGFKRLENTPPMYLWVDLQTGKRTAKQPTNTDGWKMAYHQGNAKYLVEC